MVDIPEDDSSQSLLSELGVQPEPHSFLESVVNKNLATAPTNPSLFDEFLNGLTFGFAGKEPEGVPGYIANLVGQGVSIAAITAATGGLADIGIGALGLEGGTATLARFAAKTVVPSQIVGALTPEDDQLKQLAYFVGGDLLMSQAPRVFRVLMGRKSPVGIAGEVATESTAETAPKIIDTVAKPSKLPTPAVVDTGVQSEVTNRLQTLLKQWDSYTKELNRVTEENNTILKKELWGDKSEDFHFNAGKDFLRKKIKNIVDKQTFSPSGAKYFEEQMQSFDSKFFTPDEILEHTDIVIPLDAMREEIASGRLQVSPEEAERIQTVINKIQGLNDTVERNVSLGLKPNASLNAAEARAKEYQALVERLNNNFAQNVTLNGLRKRMLSTVDEIAKLPGDLPANISNIADITKLGQVFQLLSGDVDAGLRVAIADKSLVDAQTKFTKITQSIAQSVASAFKQIDKPTQEALDIADTAVRSMTPIAPQDATKVRQPLLQLLFSRLNNLGADIIPDDYIAQQAPLQAQGEFAPVLKQFYQDFFTNPLLAEQVIQKSGDGLLQRGYYLYRASFGDLLYTNKYAALMNASGSKLNIDLATKSAINAMHFEDTPPTGGNGSLPPPSAPSGTTPPAQPPQTTPPTSSINMSNPVVNGVSPIARQTMSPSVIMDKKIADNAGTPFQAIYQKGRDLIDRLFNARVRIQQVKQTELFPLLNKAKQALMSLTPDQRDAVTTLLQTIDAEATRLSEKNIPQSIASARIDEIVNSQSPEVKKIYRDHFKVIADWIYNKLQAYHDAYNLAIKNGEIQGEMLPPVPYRVGYIPAMYDGDWAIRYFDGQTVRHLGFTNDNKEAVEMVKSFLQKNPTLQGKLIVEPRYVTDAQDFNPVGALYADMNTIFGRDINQIRKLISNGQFRPDTLADSFLGSLLPRVANLEANRFDFWDALYIKAVSAIRYGEMLQNVKLGQNIFDELSQIGDHTGANLVKTLVNDSLSRSRDLEQNMDRFLSGVVSTLHKVPGTQAILDAMGITENSRILRRITGGLMFLGRASALGMNPGTALLNTALFATNVAPLAGAKNAAYALSKIAQVYAENSPVAKLMEKAGIKLIAGGLGGKDTLAAPEFLAGRSNIRNIINKIDAMSMWMFNESEKLTRGLSLIAFRRQAEGMAKRLVNSEPNTYTEKTLAEIAQKLGKSLSHPDVLDEYALKMMKQTNFTFDISDLPELMRNPVAKPFLQFKTFFVKQMEFMLGLEYKQDRAAFFKTLGVLTSLGGLMALPGINEIDKLSQIAFGFSPKLWIENTLGEIPAAGIPATMGIDLSQRVGFGDLTSLMDLGNVGGLYPAKVYKALKAYSEGRVDEAKEIMKPGFLKALTDAYQIATTGVLTDPFQPGTEYEITNPVQAVAASIGFPTLEEERLRRLKQGALAFEANIRQERANAYRSAYDAYRNGDYADMSDILQTAGIKPTEWKQWLKKAQKTGIDKALSLVSQDQRQEFTDEYNVE